MELPINPATDSKLAALLCPNCENGPFKGKQSLSTHMRIWCRKLQGINSPSSPQRQSKCRKSLFTANPVHNCSNDDIHVIDCSDHAVVNCIEETVPSSSVASVDDTVLDTDENTENMENENSDTSTRGDKVKRKRRGYTAEFKMEVLDVCRRNEMRDIDVADKFGITKQLVSEWKKREEQIAEAAATNRKNHKKLRQSNKHSNLYVKLYEKFRAHRNRGLKVSHKWIHIQAEKINKELHGEKVKVLGRHVVKFFIQRYKIKMRRKQRGRSKPKESFIAPMMSWCSTLRETCVKAKPDDPTYDPKYGYYKPEMRINVDQSPLPFVIDHHTTYEINITEEQRPNHKVWIRQPGSSLDKRQCTLQIAFSPGDTQVRIAVIFKGKGRVGKDERLLYHPAVDVYFQENAWADSKFCLEWCEKTLKPAVADLDRFLLYCDNLQAQVQPAFKSAIHDIKGLVWYGIANATDIWQPVDAGYAQLLKRFIGQEQHKWLCEGDNIDRWLENDKKLSAKERRILITEWVGEAYTRLQGPDYGEYRKRMFTKTGCLITADGSDDNLITPEGLVNFVVPPPMPIRPPTEPAEPQTPDAATEHEDADGDETTHPNDDDSSVEEESDDEEILSDEKADRDYKHNFVGARIKVLYDFGWATGKIAYHNKHLGLKVLYKDDGSEDFIKEDDIDGTEVILQI